MIHIRSVLFPALCARLSSTCFANTQRESGQAQALSPDPRWEPPNLKMQMDVYHMQILEGELAMKLRKCAAHHGHVQIAGVPERDEPDTGEIRYSYLFDLLNEIGYDDSVGCRYRPACNTMDGLGWFRSRAAGI